MFEASSKESLGNMVKAHRESKKISQIELAKEIGGHVNRSHIAHLEQGLRLPPTAILAEICQKLNIPEQFWKPFTSKEAVLRMEFESWLSELVGIPISLTNHDKSVIEVVEKLVSDIFSKTFTSEQAYSFFQRILVFYDIPQMSTEFFERYITPDAFKDIASFQQRIEEYQKDAIRLFSSFEDAYAALNSHKKLSEILFPLTIKSDSLYRERTEWTSIINIPDEKLPYLGYIAASRVKVEESERKDLANFLNLLADQKRKNELSLNNYNEKTKRKYDSLLRKFNSKIEHSLFSPLFSPSPEFLEREAKFIKPEGGNDFEEMEKTQIQAYENLAHYLSADFMDVYVATSMRSDADFVSVNNFTKNLFNNPDIRPLKLRYFNPTQSWIEDRIAKGLVEALMLKRADFCIYMAQKEDTFGKDSEASVSLGQGKPVIVYVPKLVIIEEKLDSEEIGKMNKAELIEEIKKYDIEFANEIDENIDDESLMGKLLTSKLESSNTENLCIAIKNHWADYDLYGEVEKRIDDQNKKTIFLNWMDGVIKRDLITSIPTEIHKELVSMLVSTTIRYEKRAKIFREVHPLALQVILSTGVLNGILVARSVDSCALILKSLIINKMDLELVVDSNNYKLIEKTSRSTMRVISRHKLLSNAFSAFYRKFNFN
ncbi:helix-turn-helix domain-containing protein [Ferruginibacter albus]|uniref:helix-turn-helix domain-containing protein n=1 Tax=Ferruginibacter albus TaxID=2875540 RepID=UPI001CC60F8A|nr:helix-turn-helix transcriptional regulator [Ferruginibacter albus]UAY51284.1 helix-turn-helix domain-containing protein [Ferruginibacter albus]